MTEKNAGRALKKGRNKGMAGYEKGRERNILEFPLPPVYGMPLRPHSAGMACHTAEQDRTPIITDSAVVRYRNLRYVPCLKGEGRSVAVYRPRLSVHSLTEADEALLSNLPLCQFTEG